MEDEQVEIGRPKPYRPPANPKVRRPGDPPFPPVLTVDDYERMEREAENAKKGNRLSAANQAG